MTTTIFAIDPGNTESAAVLIDAHDCRPILAFKRPNHDVLKYLAGHPQTWDDIARPDDDTAYAIEQVESFGMAVAHAVFETCHWAGRFQQCLEGATGLPDEVHLITRKTVKRAICGNIHAKDPNIKTALVDRFAPNVPNHGKGSKAEPGWFYGFAADMWAAYAVAVTLSDQLAA